jgi:hypothetical protein
MPSNDNHNDNCTCLHEGYDESVGPKTLDEIVI